MADLAPFEVYGANDAALFTLKIFRGERMCLLGMNWKTGQPPNNFVGFGIEYMQPNQTAFSAVPNRLSFPGKTGTLSSLLSPIQKFRWVHFPPQPDLEGDYTYRVTPVFMDAAGNLTNGDTQTAAIQLESETYPGVLNIAFTRGFVMSQAFTDKFQTGNTTQELLPGKNDDHLTFVSANPQQAAALQWMGFKSRQLILDTLDAAIADPTAQVRVAAYDLDLPEVVNRLVKLGSRLKIIIDDSDTKKPAGKFKNAAESLLVTSTGDQTDPTQRQFVKRGHLGTLQHSKTIAVKGNNLNVAIGGSTNFSWRGFYIQNNNAIVVKDAHTVGLFFAALDNLFANPDSPSGFAGTPSAEMVDLNLPGVQVSLAFSPHNSHNTCLQNIANDINTTQSSLMFSLAFLYQAPGPIYDSIYKVTNTAGMFVYGISDKAVQGQKGKSDGLDFQAPDGNPPVAFPATLVGKVPEPFKSEYSGGAGINMHHKFVVIDFDKPTARVYMGSYNFSGSADLENGENLWQIKDRRVAVSYMIEAVSIFDHYEWRDAESKATAAQPLELQTPSATPWFLEDYTVPEKAKDRILFSQVSPA